jgi:glycosyltransferase involved in cell wall biosynthesis
MPVRDLFKMTTGEVTIVIVNWQALQTLPRCLDCLGAQTLQPAAILLVDNSESGECASLCGRLPNLRIISTRRNLGFAAANNLALAETKTDWVALLNPDAFPEPKWLERLLQAAHRHPECASFGSIQLLDADARLLDGAGDQYHFSGLMRRAAHLKPRDRFAPRQDKKIFSPCAAAALYRTAALQAVSGFDEDFFCYAEDVDLGFRLRLAGHDSLLVHDAIVRHVGSASTGDKRSAFATYHGHRNMVWVFVKNMPGVLFWLCLPLHILVNVLLIFVLALRGQGPVALRSKRDALLGLPQAWSKRASIQSSRQASVFQIWRELEKIPPLD